MAKLYRVQRQDGRGPYRPGFSQLWTSKDGPACLPWWTEIGITLEDGISRIPTGMAGGSAFASPQALVAWFTPEEREKLDGLGFFVVKFRPDKMIAETPTQVVFAQSYPLARLPMHCRLTDQFLADLKAPEPVS